MQKKKRVVVTGMGLVSCHGSDVEKYYDLLLAGQSGIGPITGFDASQLQTRFGGEIKDWDPGDYMDKKQGRRTDRYIQYTVVAGKKALEHAQVTPEVLASFDKLRCGVLIGSGMGGMGTFYDGAVTLREQGAKRISPFFVPYIITNMGSGLLAMDLGFMGPNYSISTACATANHSIIAAMNHIRKGDADLMICGGTEAPIIELAMAGFNACRALSTRNEEPTKASRPWDKNRDGFVMGEGSGVLVLESLEHALARKAPIYAEVLGGGMSCDAYHMTSLRPDGQGISLCIGHTLADAGIDKKRVNYVNAHGTSTPAGDMVECKGVQDFFGDVSHMKMNSTKSIIGHGLGAAGGLEAIAVIQAIRRNELHPTINIDDLEPDVRIDVCANKAQKHKIDVAISNSFGFGGHNATIALSAYH